MLIEWDLGGLGRSGGVFSGAGVEHNTIYHNQVKVGAYDQPEIFGRVDDQS